MLDNRLTYIGKYEAYDYESLTIDNTVGGVGLTSTKLTTTPKPIRVIITIEAATLRYRYDGTAPLSSEGHILNANDVLIVEGISNMKNLKMIRTTTTSATVRVSYER